MAYKANFKTAFHQREIADTMKVNADGKVGYLYTIGTDTLMLLTTAPVAGTKYAMIAQSDMSLANGHIPVENRDYRYSDEIKASSAAPKRVAYFVVDTTDINYSVV